MLLLLLQSFLADSIIIIRWQAGYNLFVAFRPDRPPAATCRCCTIPSPLPSRLASVGMVAISYAEIDAS
jgi:hypothetical protein